MQNYLSIWWGSPLGSGGLCILGKVMLCGSSTEGIGSVSSAKRVVLVVMNGKVILSGNENVALNQQRVRWVKAGYPMSKVGGLVR